MRMKLRGRTTVALVLVTALAMGCSDERPETLVASAKGYLATGDTKAAVIQLKNALQKAPDLAEARFLLGKSLLESGDVLAAEKELQKALELKYPAAEVNPALARVLVMTGNYKRVADEFSQAEAATPQGTAELKTALGQAQLVLGNWDAARSAFSAAQSADPRYAPAVLGQATIKASEGDIPGASALVENALASSPKMADAWQLKGALLAAQGQQDASIDAYRKALEANPNYLPAHVAIVSFLGQSGKLDEAAKQLEAMQKVAPSHPQTLHIQALLAYYQKNFTAARAAIQEELRVLPDSLGALTLAAAIDLELKSYSSAETNLLKVLSTVPNQLFVRRLLISTYMRGGQPIKAMDALKPVLDKIDNNSDMLAVAGEVYRANRQGPQAAKFFEKAAALDPKNAPKRTAVALSHLAIGDTERGFRELEQTATSDAGNHADLALIAANLQRGDFDRTLAAINSLEKKLPDSPVPRNLQGSTLLAKKDVAGARKSYESALALDPTYFPAAFNLAKLDLADQKPDDARKRFEAILAKDPKNTEALLALAGLRAQAGAPVDEVALMIGRAVTARPADMAPRQALINLYLRSDQPKKAVKAAQDALATFPDRPEILDLLGIAQNAGGEANEALTTFDKLAQVQPGSPMPYLRMAGIQMAAKDYDAAMRSLKKALAINPDLVPAQRGMAGLYLTSGKVQDALAVARDIQKQRPKESAGYLLEGEIRGSRKEWPEAIAAYRAGLKQSNTADLAIRLHAVLGAGGQGADADKFAATWIKDHPKDSAVRIYLAETAMSKKEYASAFAQYKTVVDLLPQNAGVLNNMAWLAGQLNDPKALEYAEKAYALAPGNAAVIDTYGMLLVNKGDTARGIELVQKAVNLAPKQMGIRLNLARALIKDGKKEAAKKELQTLSELGDKFPRHAEVSELMKGL